MFEMLKEFFPCLLKLFFQKFVDIVYYSNLSRFPRFVEGLSVNKNGFLIQAHTPPKNATNLNIV